MTRRTVLILLTLFSCLAPAIATPVRIEYFAQAGCEECRKVNALILPRLKERYSGQYELFRYDIGNPEHYMKLAAIQEHLGNPDNSPVCMIVGDRFYLGGFREIEQSLFAVLEEARRSPEAAVETTSTGVLLRRGESFTLGTVLLAGLVDGINPCVFATLIFFISLLTAASLKRSTLFWVGIAYCSACFLAYLALGFGLFRFLRLLSGAQNVIEWLLIGILLLFALISFRDAWRFKRGGRARDIVLQLPDSLKRKIHAVMKRGLKYRYLIPGAFAIGLAVTLIESVCTGQVYVPTLVLLSREFGAGSRWFLYLLLYNLMFIVPLLVIFAAAWRGTGIPAFIAWSKKHVVWSKVVLGCFFLFLCGVMLW